jgi:hypothetical protein
MDEPYGAIFDQSEPDIPQLRRASSRATCSPKSTVQASRASDFANVIFVMPPGTQIYLDTLRNWELMLRTLTLGSTPCWKSERVRNTAA